MLTKILDAWAERRLKTKELRAQELSNNLQSPVEEPDYEKIVEDILKAELDQIESAFDIFPCRIKIGDKAIINKYELGGPCKNGWDGGPQALLTHLKEIQFPVTVTIKDVYVDRSYAEELIERWLSKLYPTEIKTLALSPTTIIPAYRRYHKSLEHRCFGDYLSVYRTATFNIDGPFKPIWGLNTNCFIPEGTSEYLETYSLWSEELQVQKLKKEAEEQLREVQDKVKSLENRVREIAGTKSL
jgi:hypothetical protein